MSNRPPIPSLARGILVGLVFWAGSARADWQLSNPGDPSRQWDVSVKSAVGYDDNIFTSTTNKESSLTESIEPSVDVKLPPGQTSGELRYTYNVTYFSDRPSAKPDQSHVLDASLSHSFTPRLTVSLSDSFRQGLEPALVSGLIERERGDYTYNDVGATLSYQLTPRWTATLNQTWDQWWFVEPDQVILNNRDDYNTTASAIFALDSRTTIGGNYSYARTAYTYSSVTNAVRDSDSQALYLSFTHQFKPLVSVQGNAGAQLAGFGGGSSEISPYLLLGVNYAFGANSTLSAGGSYNIQVSEVAQFRSSDQLSMYLNLTHHFTRKFSAAFNFSYTIASYRNLSPVFENPYDITQKSSVSEDSWGAILNLNYNFTPWCSAFANYSRQEVRSGFDNRIIGFLRSFDRNQYSVGLQLAY